MGVENTVNYDDVLTDLMAKRDKLNAAIEAIQELRGNGTASDISHSSATSTQQAGAVDVLRDTFFGMSIPDAAKKFLAMSKKAMSTQDIAEALERGGFTHGSGNFSNTVGSVLHRLDGTGGGIVRVARGIWGLAEWYPGRNKSKE